MSENNTSMRKECKNFEICYYAGVQTRSEIYYKIRDFFNEKNVNYTEFHYKNNDLNNYRIFHYITTDINSSEITRVVVYNHSDKKRVRRIWREIPEARKYDLQIYHAKFVAQKYEKSKVKPKDFLKLIDTLGLTNRTAAELFNRSNRLLKKLFLVCIFYALA